MLQRFRLVEQDVGNYTQELVNFCSSLKDQINLRAEKQNKDTDATIKCISEDLLQKETAISEKLEEGANNSVSAILIIHFLHVFN